MPIAAAALVTVRQLKLRFIMHFSVVLCELTVASEHSKKPL